MVCKMIIEKNSELDISFKIICNSVQEAEEKKKEIEKDLTGSGWHVIHWSGTVYTSIVPKVSPKSMYVHLTEDLGIGE